MSALSVMVATAACGQHFFASENFVRVLLMGICMQAGGNCTNTYFDYHRGVDTKNSGEKTLVDGVIPPKHMLFMSNLFYVLSAVAAWPFLQPTSECSDSDLCYYVRILFGVGISLAYAYTASPFSLKYRALGGLALFVCFGPLLMQLTSLILLGNVHHVFYIYSVPVGSLVWATYLANDARDINSDEQAGVTTLPIWMGYQNAGGLFRFLVITAFVATFTLGTFFHWGCFLGFLVTPDVQNLMLLSMRGKDAEIPALTHKVMVKLSTLLVVGILISPNENFPMLTQRYKLDKAAEVFLNSLPPPVLNFLNKWGTIGLGYFGIH